MKKLILTMFFMGGILGHAELFTFDLVNKEGAPWDNVSSGMYTNAGMSLTLDASLFAYINGSYSTGSKLNSTASSFGINALGTSDAPAFFDTNHGQEALWISFNHPVVIKTIRVTDFTPGNVETGAYQVASGNLIHFTDSGTYNIDAALDAGSFFKVVAIDEGGGNGWQLDLFSVEAIPEPTAFAMLGLGSLIAVILYRSTHRGMYRN